jgi:RNA polymerase sigma-70 factor (ECF subfamily)
VSTAQDLPVPYGEPAPLPHLRVVPAEVLDFDETVRRVQPRLLRFAVRRIGDLHEAEEVVQEALLRAYSHRAQLLTEDDVAAWCTVVTGRLVIDRLRVRGRSTPVADVPEGVRVGRDTADVVVARDEARLALNALDAMPPRQAALLWAREVEGSSYDELCTRFAMSEAAVRSVLTRARKALRKEYALRGGTLPVAGLAFLAPWVAGLTWAEKLRRAATRVSAPAALSALGLSALGGLVLSPFGLLPDHGHAPYEPIRAVVADDVPAALPHGPNPLPYAAPRTVAVTAPVAAVPVSRDPAWQRAALRVATACVNDTDSTDQGQSITYGGTSIGGASAGGGQCDRARTLAGGTLYLALPLPTNPTKIRYLGITSDSFTCTNVPTLVVLKCTPPSSSTPTGAQP